MEVSTIVFMPVRMVTIKTPLCHTNPASDRYASCHLHVVELTEMNIIMFVTIRSTTCVVIPGRARDSERRHDVDFSPCDTMRWIPFSLERISGNSTDDRSADSAAAGLGTPGKVFGMVAIFHIHGSEIIVIITAFIS